MKLDSVWLQVMGCLVEMTIKDKSGGQYTDIARHCRTLLTTNVMAHVLTPIKGELKKMPVRSES